MHDDEILSLMSDLGELVSEMAHELQKRGLDKNKLREFDVFQRVAEQITQIQCGEE